jgi:Ca2+-binding EF-hand superfamily protein
MVVSQHCSDQEVYLLADRFKEIDADSTGTISFQELAKSIQDLNIQVDLE